MDDLFSDLNLSFGIDSLLTAHSEDTLDNEDFFSGVDRPRGAKRDPEGDPLPPPPLALTPLAMVQGTATLADSDEFVPMEDDPASVEPIVAKTSKKRAGGRAKRGKTAFEPDVNGELAVHRMFSPVVSAAYDALKAAEMDIAACVTLQSQAPVGDVDEHYVDLLQRYSALQAALDGVQRDVNGALSETVLSAQDVSRALWLKDECLVLEAHRSCLEQEASALRAQPDAEPLPLLSLAITGQPFPLTLIQNKAVEDSVSLRLLTGTRTRVVKTENVEASMIVDFAPKKADELLVINGTAPMKQGVALVCKIKFKHGTRKKKAILKFRQKVHVQYQGKVVVLDVESNATKPFVVKTNERQWREAEQSLLLLAAFGGMVRCPFAQVYNAYHWHFLRAATKQVPASPQRALSEKRALPFIASLFFNNETHVSQAAFNRFWDWVGPTEHKLAHQRDLMNMFNAGRLIGFVTRKDAIALLEDRRAGTFLIRFSVKYAGEFAISFRTSTAIKHYAIKPDDVMLQQLADFLLSSDEKLTTLLAVDVLTDEIVELDAKTHLAPYCSGTKGLDPPEGYEKTLVEGLKGVKL